MHDEACNPKMITSSDTFQRPNLELPFSRHALRICPGNFDASIQAGSVVSFYDISTKNCVGTHCTVVCTFKDWEEYEQRKMRYMLVLSNFPVQFTFKNSLLTQYPWNLVIKFSVNYERVYQSLQRFPTLQKQVLKSNAFKCLYSNAGV